MIYQVTVTQNGTQFWRYNGVYHREGDLPAAIWKNGDVSYWKNGKLHRDGDKPAVILSTGYVAYWKEGKRYYPTPKAECAGKVVEIEGVKYKLTEVS